MKLKVMTFNICHGADYRKLVSENSDSCGPICFGYAPSEELFSKGDIQNVLDRWNQSVNLEQIADILRQSECDIIGLNEVRGEGPSPYYDNQAEILANLTGLHYFFAPAVEFPNEGSYGTAILSRFPIVSGEIVRIPPAKELSRREPRCFLKATVQAENAVTVLISHFGGHPREQEISVDTLLSQMTHLKTPVLFLGDLNTTPGDGILDRIYEKMEEAFFPENPATFPSFHPVRKIDYIFASGPAQFSEQRVLDVVASDHFPLVATVEFTSI